MQQQMKISVYFVVKNNALSTYLTRSKFCSCIIHCFNQTRHGWVLCTLRLFWKFPAQDGAIRADAGDVLGVGANFDAVDEPAVPDTHMRHLALIVFPQLLKQK